MEANPPEINPELAAQAREAKRVLMLAMGVMVALPLLLFVLFHT